MAERTNPQTKTSKLMNKNQQTNKTLPWEQKKCISISINTESSEVIQKQQVYRKEEENFKNS